MKAVKYLFVGLGVVVLLTAAAVVGAFLYVENANHKDLVQSLVRDNTGMTAKVDKVSLKVYPEIDLVAEGIKVLPFSGDKNVFESDRLVVKANLWSAIFSKKVELIELVAPKVYLHRHANGKSNWEKPRKSRHEKSGSVPVGMLALLDKLSLTDGDIVFNDEKSGSYYQVRNLNMSIDSETASKKKAVFKAVVNEIPVSVDSRFKVSDFNDTVPMETVLGLGENSLKLNGTLVNVSSEELGFTGKVDLQGRTLVKSLQTFGLIQAGGGVPNQPIMFSGDVKLNPDVNTLNGIKLSIGDNELRGDITVKSNRKRPLIEGGLAMDELDLNRLQVCGKADVADGAGAKSGAAKDAKTPWSDDIIDLTGLLGVDFDMEFKVNKLVCDTYELNAFVIDAENVAGKLRLNDLSFAAADGGSVAIDGDLSAVQPVGGSANIKLNKLALEQFAGSDKFELPLSADASLAFRGNSTAAWAKSLSGEVSASSEGGRLAGISLSGFNNALGSLLGKNTENAEKFSALDAAYVIENGVARTERFTLKGPQLNVTGDGKIDLANWTINYRLVPSVKVAGASVPVVVRGNLYKPSIMPDVTSPQGIATGLGAVVGGPVGAAAGNVLGTMIDNVTNGKKQEGTDGKVQFDLGDKDNLEQNVKNFLGGFLKK